MERDLTFELRDAQSRVHGSKVQFFGPFGIGIEWEPTFHVSDFYTSGNFRFKYCCFDSLKEIYRLSHVSPNMLRISTLMVSLAILPPPTKVTFPLLSRKTMRQCPPWRFRPCSAINTSSSQDVPRRVFSSMPRAFAPLQI